MLKLVINNKNPEEKVAEQMREAAKSTRPTQQEMLEWVAYLQLNAMRDVWVERLGHEHLICEGLVMLSVK